MMKLVAIMAVMTLCAASASAHADRREQGCGLAEPETTGSLPADPRSLRLTSEKPDVADAGSLDEPWQQQADEEAELHRERLVTCGGD
jgi:ABC-type molybdate transport system substrate-binding protein